MLHDQIREARIKSGLTIAQLARLSGVARGRLTAFEQKGENITIETLEKIVTHLPVGRLVLGDVEILPKGVNTDVVIEALKKVAEAVEGALDVLETAKAEAAKEAEAATAATATPPPPPAPEEPVTRVRMIRMPAWNRRLPPR